MIDKGKGPDKLPRRIEWPDDEVRRALALFGYDAALIERTIAVRRKAREKAAGADQ